MRRVLIVSNGFGEDLIGRHLVDAFSQHSEIQLTVFPLVGTGIAYQNSAATIAGHNLPLPSGGFLRSWRDGIRDITHGIIRQTWQQYQQLKHLRRTTDICVAVGDVFCLLMSTGLIGKRGFFLPTAKSDLFMPHSAIEYAIIKNRAYLSFPRDPQTSLAFDHNQVPSQWLGNVMMDALIPAPPPTVVPQKITLLPGSRQEATDNLRLLLSVAQAIQHLQADFTFELALAPQFTPHQLQQALAGSAWIQQQDELQTPQMCVSMSRDFKSSICSCSAVIGLAGTANEQAAFLGKPVFCFEGTGPQSTRTRFQEQSLLTQGTVRFIESTSIPDIAHQIVAQLRQLTPLALPENQCAAPRIVSAILNRS